MCEAVGIKILNLKRTQIGNIKLENLPIGKYRYLSEKEIKELKN